MSQTAASPRLAEVAADPAAPARRTATSHRRPVLGPVRSWSLALSDDPDALVRVLSLLRRRRCQVLSVRYDAGDVHRPQSRLHVLARPDGGRPETLEAWLRGLPDVLAVDPAR